MIVLLYSTDLITFFKLGRFHWGTRDFLVRCVILDSSIKSEHATVGELTSLFLCIISRTVTKFQCLLFRHTNIKELHCDYRTTVKSLLLELYKTERGTVLSCSAILQIRKNPTFELYNKLYQKHWETMHLAFSNVISRIPIQSRTILYWNKIKDGY